MTWCYHLIAFLWWGLLGILSTPLLIIGIYEPTLYCVFFRSYHESQL